MVSLLQVFESKAKNDRMISDEEFINRGIQTSTELIAVKERFLSFESLQESQNVNTRHCCQLISVYWEIRT